MVDTLRFDSLWRSDHLLSLAGVPTRRGLDTWTSLAALATMTGHIRFGPLVSPITFHHPSILARQAATVDELSGGRLELGMGAGWYDIEHQMFGLPFPRPRDRIQMLDEAVHLITALWSEGPVEFAGKYYRLKGAVGWPKPVQRPRIPVIIGGKGRRLLQVVAKHADEWNCGGNQSPTQVRARTRMLVAECERIGRDPSTIRRSWQGGFLIGETGASLERRARKIQECFPALASMPASKLPHALRSEGWLVGQAADILGQIRDLAAEGIERIMLQFFDLEDVQALRSLAEDVIPQLT
jgi:alkanesulfonate monooxygenase SsuD/methylene tetrahydromethanopterin reductase-like flavin-dependent oxidoreductase (luciferase family)